jgi:hypothetical protein
MYDENNKLESLTPEQEARFPEFVKFGLSIGLSTERSDRVAGEKALRDHYLACGLDAPTSIQWFDSPLHATLAYVNEEVRSEVWNEVRIKVWNKVGNEVRSEVWNEVRSEVGNKVWNKVGNKVWNKVGNKVRSEVGNKVWNVLGALLDADYASLILAYDQYGIGFPTKCITFLEVNKHIWWYYATDTTVYVSDRPVFIKTNNEGHLHCENGKAIEFADGFGISSWHGQTIPNEWVTGNLPTPSEALNWENMDQRSVVCELIGWANLREHCNSTTIDIDDDPMWGELVEMDLPDSPGERFLFVTCGTGRPFALLVPKETQTVDEAQSVLHGGLPVEILKNCIERT